eukprot:3936132-Rhodomonas_salina.2
MAPSAARSAGISAAVSPQAHVPTSPRPVSGTRQFLTSATCSTSCSARTTPTSHVIAASSVCTTFSSGSDARICVSVCAMSLSTASKFRRPEEPAPSSVSDSPASFVMHCPPTESHAVGPVLAAMRMLSPEGSSSASTELDVHAKPRCAKKLTSELISNVLTAWISCVLSNAASDAADATDSTAAFTTESTAPTAPTMTSFASQATMSAASYGKCTSTRGESNPVATSVMRCRIS